MFKKYICVLISCSTILLSGCIGAISKSACENADYYHLGFDEALNGNKAFEIDEYRQICSGFGIPVKSEEYLKGRTAGLSKYCTPKNGYQVGANGHSYFGICSKQQEEKFVKSYILGLKEYCTPVRGFRDGKSGEKEATSCKEHNYLSYGKEYLLGFKIRRLESRKTALEKQINNLDEEILALRKDERDYELKKRQLERQQRFAENEYIAVTLSLISLIASTSVKVDF